MHQILNRIGIWALVRDGEMRGEVVGGPVHEPGIIKCWKL